MPFLQTSNITRGGIPFYIMPKFEYCSAILLIPVAERHNLLRATTQEDNPLLFLGCLDISLYPFTRLIGVTDCESCVSKMPYLRTLSNDNTFDNSFLYHKQESPIHNYKSPCLLPRLFYVAWSSIYVTLFKL